MPAKLKFSREEVLAAYAGKASIADAAKTLGCSSAPLIKLMRKLGIPSKGKGRSGVKKSAIPELLDHDWLHREIVELGRTQRDVAVQLGTTPGNVAHHVRRHMLYERVSQSEAAKQWLARRFPAGRFGPDAGHWKGGRINTHGRKGTGYVRVYQPDHPAANSHGQVYEHRLVMEKKLGRLLTAEEVVDHIDRNKSNNAPENLRLHPNRQAHVSDHFNARAEVVEMRGQLAEKVKRIAELEAMLGWNLGYLDSRDDGNF